MARVFYSFPHDFGERPRPRNLTREIHIPIVGRLTAQDIIDNADDILLSPPSMAVLVVPGSDMEQSTSIQRAIGHVIGNIMADSQEQRLRDMQARLIFNEWGFGWPAFANEEEMREFYRQMGLEIEYVAPQPVNYIGYAELMESATTLRQRAFARMYSGYSGNPGKLSLRDTNVHGMEIKMITKGARGMMAACYRNRDIRAKLRKLTITAGTRAYGGDPEVHVGLQDLADIVAIEAHAAFTEEYYPGMPDVDALTDEEVDAVMAGMQREATRERRGTQEVLYKKLPRPRQVALAERRRHWFGVFGITPKSWKTGKWSLWNVKSIPFPEDYRRDN